MKAQEGALMYYVWFEIINLVVPTYTDKVETIRRMCGWIAKELGAELVETQHYHCHAASLKIDRKVDGPIGCLTWDGTGFGTDATIWGGVDAIKQAIYDHGPIAWAEFWRVVNGEGPCHRERMPARVAAHSSASRIAGRGLERTNTMRPSVLSRSAMARNEPAITRAYHTGSGVRCRSRGRSGATASEPSSQAPHR